ncbi:hypothetical protein ACIQKB_04205 [Streptomyces sp. NPDC092046]|uniref:hypothetical protein n=1 Tax=Streptomyces sp. NPDC092046 TaxID=3366009 RepID=UPI00381384D7
MAAPRRSAKAAADASDEPEVEENGQEADETAADKEAEVGPTALERAYMDALQRERAGYEMRGLTDRVKQVDAELKRFER